MAEAILVVKIDSEGNVQAIKQARQEIASTGEQSKKTGDSLAGLKKAAAFAAGAFAAIKSAQAAVDFVKMGAQVQAVEQRFVAFAGGAEQAQAYMEAFATATDGTVDRMGAMAGASKMLQMGLVDNAGEMETMAAIAVKLGDQTMGASNRLADFSALLANRSIPRLDNFGISSGRVRERVEELTKAGLALDQAFKLAVLEEGSKSLAILGDTSELASTKIAIVEAAAKDAKVAIALLAAEVADSSGLLAVLAYGMRDLADTAEVVTKKGLAAAAAQDGQSRAAKNLSGDYDRLGRSTQEVWLATTGAERAAAMNARAQAILAGEMDKTAKTYIATGKAVFLLQGEIEALEETYGTSTVAQAQYSAAMQSTYEGMDRAAIAAAAYYTELDRQSEVLATSRAKLLDFGTAYTDFYRDIEQEAEDSATRRGAIEEGHEEALKAIQAKGLSWRKAVNEEGVRLELRIAQGRLDELLARQADFNEETSDLERARTEQSIGEYQGEIAQKTALLQQAHDGYVIMKGQNVDALLAEEERQYGESIAKLDEAQAAQELAQEQSLGRMLLQHFEAWGQMKGLTIEQMTEMRLKISEDYGLIDEAGAQAARNQIQDWALYFSMGAAGWADLDAKRQRFQDGVNALKGKTVDIRIRTIHETIGKESPGATIPELTRQHGGPAAGLVLVHGPELVQLPQGSYVYSPEQTRQMMGVPARPLPPGRPSQAGAMAGPVVIQAPALVLVQDPKVVHLSQMGYAYSPLPDRQMPAQPSRPWTNLPEQPMPAGMGGGGRSELHLHLNIMANAVRSDEDIEQIMAGMDRILNLRGAREYRI